MRSLVRLLLPVAILLVAGLAPDHAARAQSGDQPAYMVRYIEVAPAAADQAAGLLKTLAEKSRAEAGMMRFDILRSPAPKGHFATYELWKDQAALDAHTAAAHKQFLEAIQPLLVAPIDNRPCLSMDVGPSQPMSAGARIAITHIDVIPPRLDSAAALFKEIAGASRKEGGSLGYEILAQIVRNNNHFQVVEMWKDQPAADAHEIAASTKDFRGKIQSLIGAAYDRRWYEPL